MPEEGDEVGRRRRLLGWIGGLQQPLEARKHGTDSGNGRRARGDAWRLRALVAVIGCGRVEKLRVGTMTFGCCPLCESADPIFGVGGYALARGRQARGPRRPCGSRTAERMSLGRREAQDPPRATVQSGKFGGNFGIAFGAALRPAILYCDVP